MNLKLNNNDGAGDEGHNSENSTFVIQDTKNAAWPQVLSTTKEYFSNAYSKNTMPKDRNGVSSNHSDKQDICFEES